MPVEGEEVGDEEGPEAEDEEDNEGGAPKPPDLVLVNAAIQPKTMILIKRDLERQLIIGVVTLSFRPNSFSFKNIWENRQKTQFFPLEYFVLQLT